VAVAVVMVMGVGGGWADTRKGLPAQSQLHICCTQLVSSWSKPWQEKNN